MCLRAPTNDEKFENVPFNRDLVSSDDFEHNETSDISDIINMIFHQACNKEQVHACLKRWHCTKWTEKVLANMVFNGEKITIRNDRLCRWLFMEVVYHSRSLAYRYIREGFTIGNSNYTAISSKQHPGIIYSKLRRAINAKICYTGKDVARLVDFSQIPTIHQSRCRQEIEKFSVAEARMFVKAVTGSAMLTPDIVIVYDSQTRRMPSFTTCLSRMTITNSALDGPSCQSVEDIVEMSDVMIQDMCGLRFIESVRWAIAESADAFRVA